MPARTAIAPQADPMRAVHCVPSVAGRSARPTDSALFVALALVHGAAVLAVPSAPLIALGIWWNSNTIAHNWIHRPFFRSRSANRLFSAYQSVLLGIPQTLWRERHLAHHAGGRWRLRLSGQLVAETALVGLCWTAIALWAPAFFLLTCGPGYLAGLALCALQGHYEHAGGATSHYGRLYNLLCFNDGYHVEHHASPGVAWSELPDRRQPDARTSRWPAPLRWIEHLDLEGLERLVLRSRTLQSLVLAAHRRAFRSLVRDLPIRRAVIIGGGLFPRTAIVLHELAPEAELIVIDASACHLAAARTFIERTGGDLPRAVTFRHARFTAGSSGDGADLVVVPLAYHGDRAALYARPPAGAMVVHDWLWRIRGESRVVSLLLLKRLNLVRS